MAHARGPSAHFSNFGNDSDEGPELHHPLPQSQFPSTSENIAQKAEYVEDADERSALPAIRYTHGPSDLTLTFAATKRVVDTLSN
ncbi:hypothetical protein F4780DRAFT_775532 [Xylariomycetidae sp. FL0641]|nr:hypothetical protein F4780DRAFT_775532 [Xylariomycetidae sp. FL0641]